MNRENFKAMTLNLAVTLFPDEELAFHECVDDVVDSLYSPSPDTGIDNLPKRSGEFAWKEEIEVALSLGKTSLEIVGLICTLMKFCGEMSQEKPTDAINDAVLKRYRKKLADVGVPAKKIEAVLNFVLVEVLKAAGRK
jgi:hypothetical protein